MAARSPVPATANASRSRTGTIPLPRLRRRMEGSRRAAERTASRTNGKYAMSHSPGALPRETRPRPRPARTNPFRKGRKRSEDAAPASAVTDSRTIFPRAQHEERSQETAARAAGQGNAGSERSGPEQSVLQGNGRDEILHRIRARRAH